MLYGSKTGSKVHRKSDLTAAGSSMQKKVTLKGAPLQLAGWSTKMRNSVIKTV